MGPWFITALSVYALVSMHWVAWGKYRSRKDPVLAGPVVPLLQVKQDRFKQEERQWLLEWIKADERGMGDIRRRWWKSNAYWCIDGLDEKQEQQLEDHLVFWARRLVENKSQYGPGGWAGTGWVRPS